MLYECNCVYHIPCNLIYSLQVCMPVIEKTNSKNVRSCKNVKCGMKVNLVGFCGPSLAC